MRVIRKIGGMPRESVGRGIVEINEETSAGVAAEGIP